MFKKLIDKLSGILTRKILSNRNVALKSVQENGKMLYWAPPEYQNDREIVLAAVKQNGLALAYASEELRRDQEVCLAAVSQDGLALAFVPSDVATQEMADAAIRKGNVLDHILKQ